MAELYVILMFLFVNGIIFTPTYGNEFNVSVTDLTSCKEYRLQSTYEYKNFFLVKNFKNVPETGELLRLKFYVMATKDAHILLSDKDKPKKNDSVYEIVIGAGGNSFSTLRRKIGTTRLAFNSVGHILTAVDPTPIEVRQSVDGTLDVIIPGMPEPHLSYKDKKPLLVKYVSFSTFGNAPARWFYDCGTDSNTNEIAIEEKKLSNVEQLQRKLFTNYSVYSVPENLKDIKFSFTIKGVTYDEQRSLLQTRIELELMWQDNKLVWNPKDYGNIKKIQTSDLSAIVYYWSPSIVIKNGADYSFHNFNPTYMGQILSNGTLKLRSMQQIIDTWCAQDSHNWPHDDVQCDIVVSADGSNVKLIHDNSKPFRNQSEISELSQWHLAIVAVFPETVINRAYRNMLRAQDDFVIRLTLKRNRLFYQRIFFTPIAVASLMLLFSLCSADFIRAGINLLAILVSALTFLLVAKYSPLTNVPKLVHLCEIVLITSCFMYEMHILVKWLYNFTPLSQPPQWVKTIVNSYGLKFVLGTHFSDDTRCITARKFPWRELSRMINRMCFIVLLILFLWVLIAQI